MKIENVYCLFEQSGTFKNEFIKLGYNAYDLDIQNNFNQCDYVVDLFQQIELGYLGKKSIFDNITVDDLVFAFFPCVRFTSMFDLQIRQQNYNIRNKSIKQKLLDSIELEKERSYFYEIISKLVIICIDRNLKLIIENPYDSQHYLYRYFPIRATVIDYDRTLRGDYYKKPTQYFFINCDPSNNLIMDYYYQKDIKKIVNAQYGIKRSLISPVYANRFIREFIL